MAATAAVIALTVLCMTWGIYRLQKHLKTTLSTKIPSSDGPVPYGTTAAASSFSLERAYASFNAYAKISNAEVYTYRTKLASLRGGHKRMALELGYRQKVDTLERCHEQNARLAKSICSAAFRSYPSLQHTTELSSKATDVGRVREAFKHLVRDWSIEGKEERKVIFSSILEELERTPGDERAGCKVLVPGAGLGRLAWEISQRGFDTTSCELSFYMNLALNLVLHPESTNRPHQHTVHPYAHWWSHQRSSSNTFRGITFPDVVPRQSNNWTLSDQDFLSLTPPNEDTAHSNSLLSANGRGGYDVIVTLYFIDTASNIISYLSHIHYLLRPGGRWINLGPLLYSNATLELSLDEVLHLANLVGFDVDTTTRKTIPSEYTADSEAMMKWIYQAEFWVATKRSDEYIL
ncbi:hypothetical protein PIIN_07620 [Serendipita indica DSM 11827]|uniref:Uncharacterized protein n=1 Tax=Serendipita indica (strain DSM 11827) TaxID=1109443 RepID=G4TQS6_SERID|nr:hypothetical protein PIIN_07620 [Serendipita indica DSM 11827]